MRQAKYYDQSAKALPVLEEGDCVRMQPFKLGENKWEKGTIVKRLDDRSYQVQKKKVPYIGEIGSIFGIPKKSPLSLNRLIH